MKARAIVAATLLLVAGSALAEAAWSPSGRGAPDLERLAILLDLDEGQKVAVKQVMDEQMQRRQEAWKKIQESQARPSREEMRVQHGQMRKETIEKLRPILSDQQMTRFEALADRAVGPRHDKAQDKAR